MEHRDEIISEMSSKKIFLQNKPVEYEKPAIYSLEEEFAKAKKNRDLMPYLVFFGFVGLLIVATMATANYLEVRTKHINIDISDFEDLRLIETLSYAKDQEQELKNLRSSFDTELQQIKTRIQREADLKNADKKALQRLIQREKERIEAVRQDYEERYAQQQAEISRLRKIIEDNAKSSRNRSNENRVLKERLDATQYGLDLYLNSKRASGCILNPDPWRLEAYLYKGRNLSAARTVKLYRTEAQYIGKLKLTPAKDGMKVEIVELAKGQSIQALDWFREI